MLTLAEQIAALGAELREKAQSTVQIAARAVLEAERRARLGDHLFAYILRDYAQKTLEQAVEIAQLHTRYRRLMSQITYAG